MEWLQSKTPSKNDVQSVAVGVSKLDNSGLTLVDPRLKIDEICYCCLLLPQKALPVICQLSHGFRNSAQCTDHASFLTLIFYKAV